MPAWTSWNAQGWQSGFSQFLYLEIPSYQKQSKHSVYTANPGSPKSCLLSAGLLSVRKIWLCQWSLFSRFLWPNHIRTCLYIIRLFACFSQVLQAILVWFESQSFGVHTGIIVYWSNIDLPEHDKRTNSSNIIIDPSEVIDVLSNIKLKHQTPTALVTEC